MVGSSHIASTWLTLTRNQEKIARAIAHHLVGDARIAAAGVPGSKVAYHAVGLNVTKERLWFTNTCSIIIEPRKRLRSNILSPTGVKEHIYGYHQQQPQRA